MSKWFPGVGQEAIAIGCVAAIRPKEFILPRIRNLGVFTSRGIDLKRLFSQFSAKVEGFTKGRDRTFHFNSLEHGIVAAPSLLGPQLEIALGLALSSKLRNENSVVLALSGDGESSQGSFHEALNVASVWKLPVLFVVENNGYALSTPSSEQYACRQLSDRAIAYGMPGVSVNGNNVLEVYRIVKQYADDMRQNPHPVLIEFNTMRMRGHEEGSGTDFMNEKELEQWRALDPISAFEQHLIQLGVINAEFRKQLENKLKADIDTAREYAENLPEIKGDLEREEREVFAPVVTPSTTPGEVSSKKRMIDAINDTLHQCMERHSDLVLMGQDIADHGGVFKATAGLMEKFGQERVRNTPLCESAIIGTAAGLSIAGIKSVVEMQFADFVVCGMNQLNNVAAKMYYRSQQSMPFVLRMPTGAAVSGGPLHSHSLESWFTHIPGLKVVYPSGPKAAKGLLASAIEDPNPVLFFEHKGLYRSHEEPVPDEYYSSPLGVADVVQDGTEASVLTYGIGVHWALEYSAAHPEVSLEIVDLQTLVPLDFEAIRSSVKKTGRALVLYEAPLRSGFGSELASLIAEHCFKYLDAPVVRCANLNTPVPQAAALEKDYLAKSRLSKKIEELLRF